MGLFEDAFAEIEKVMMEGVESDLEEYNINKKRPSITSLPFMRFSDARIEQVRKLRPGLLLAGTKKKLIRSMEEGRTTYAEVLVLARGHRLVDRSEHDPRFDIYRYFYKVADLSGNVIREDVPVLDDKYAFGLEYNGGDSASESGCADTVDPALYMHAYILHYYLGDDQYYVLLTREQFEDLTVFIKNAGGYYHFAEDGVGYIW